MGIPADVRCAFLFSEDNLPENSSLMEVLMYPEWNLTNRKNMFAEALSAGEVFPATGIWMSVKYNFIGGRWSLSRSGRVCGISDPFTGETVAMIPDSSREDALAAVEAARASFDGSGLWHEGPAQLRAELFEQAAKLMKTYRFELSRLDRTGTGKKPSDSLEDIDQAIFIFRTLAKDLLSGEECSIPAAAGVCALITPEKCPLLLSVQLLAPLLAAGNSVVLKPESRTPLAIIFLFELLERAGFPAGSVNLVLGADAAPESILRNSLNVDRLICSEKEEAQSFAAVS